METRVKIEAASDTDESPARIWIKGIKLEILEIEDRWYSEEHSYYKIFADNARHYILKSTKNDSVWTAQEIFVK
jgi:hypothetical protein